MGNYPIGRALTGRDHTGEIRDVHVHRRDDHDFALVMTRTFLGFNPRLTPFLNEVNGAAMNQNVTFGGTPEIIHNGGTSTEWTGSAVQGSWDFSTDGVITLTDGDNNDAATFAEETPTTIDLANFTALTGVINLTTYSAVNNGLSIAFDNAGTQVGNTVNLEAFIDTSLLGTAQNFAISLDAFDFSATVVDGFTITLVRTGGAKPSMTFDDITIQATGSPLEYRATAQIGTKLHIKEIRIALADNETGIVTVAGATENHSMINLGYDKLLSVSTLSNGIIFQVVLGGVIVFSATIKQLGDFLALGADITNVISDGTNTFITLSTALKEPIVLTGDIGDYLSFTINDNLSSLLQFTATARGSTEVELS